MDPKEREYLMASLVFLDERERHEVESLTDDELQEEYDELYGAQPDDNDEVPFVTRDELASTLNEREINQAFTTLPVEKPWYMDLKSILILLIFAGSFYSWVAGGFKPEEKPDIPVIQVIQPPGYSVFQEQPKAKIENE